TGTGYSPEAVFVMSTAGKEAVMRTSLDSKSYNFGAPTGADYISSLDSDGFTVNSDGRVNSSGVTYYYITWNQMPGTMDVGTYAGTGLDNRNITGLGFQPEWVMIH